MRVNHVRQGSGEPLVLIHGIGHRLQAWLPVLDRLAAHHDVLALDLPGFGDSPVPPGGMPPDVYAQYRSLLDQYNASLSVERAQVSSYNALATQSNGIVDAVNRLLC